MQTSKLLLLLAVLSLFVLGSASSFATDGGGREGAPGGGQGNGGSKGASDGGQGNGGKGAPDGGQGNGGGGQGQGNGDKGNKRDLPAPPLPPGGDSVFFRCPERAACLWDLPYYIATGYYLHGWARAISDSAGGEGWKNLPEEHRRAASSAKNKFANRVVRFSRGRGGKGKRICLRPGERVPQFGPRYNDAIRSFKVSGLGGSCPEGR